MKQLLMILSLLVTAASDSIIAGVVGSGIDTTAFHHNAPSDSFSNLHVDTAYIRGGLHLRTQAQAPAPPGACWWFDFPDPTMQSIFSFHADYWGAPNQTKLSWYKEGFEVLDTFHQRLGDSIHNPSYRIYMGYAYADRGLFGSIPYSFIAQNDSAQAAMGAETTGGRRSFVKTIGSTSGKWSDTAYMASSLGFYTNGHYFKGDTGKTDSELITRGEAAARGLSLAAVKEITRRLDAQQAEIAALKAELAQQKR